MRINFRVFCYIEKRRIKSNICKNDTKMKCHIEHYHGYQNPYVTDEKDFVPYFFFLS